MLLGAPGAEQRGLDEHLQEIQEHAVSVLFQIQPRDALGYDAAPQVRDELSAGPRQLIAPPEGGVCPREGSQSQHPRRR